VAEFSTEPGNEKEANHMLHMLHMLMGFQPSAFFPPVFAAYFRSRVDDETCGFIRKRDNASPRFWINASD
jgi:hypothetical protein